MPDVILIVVTESSLLQQQLDHSHPPRPGSVTSDITDRPVASEHDSCSAKGVEYNVCPWLYDIYDS